MRLLLSLLVFVFSVPISAAAWTTETSDLVALTVNAYGGPKAIEDQASYRQTGTLNSYRHGKSGRVTRTYSRPDKLRIEIEIEGTAPEVRVLNGERGWRHGKEVNDVLLRSMVLQAARFDIPWLLMQAGDAVKLAGPVEPEGGRELKALEVLLAEDLRIIVVIDAKTGLIVRSHGIMIFGPGQSMEFATLYGDHKDLDGMMVGAEETHYAQGRETGRTVLHKVTPVTEPEEAVFKP